MNKFKQWLIIKLGGFIDQQVNVVETKTKTEIFTEGARHLSVGCIINKDVPLWDLQRIAKQRLAELLSQNIVQLDDICITSHYIKRLMAYECRMDLLIKGVKNENS